MCSIHYNDAVLLCRMQEKSYTPIRDSAYSTMKKSSKTVNGMNNVCRLTFCSVLYYFTFMIILANYFRTDKVL